MLTDIMNEYKEKVCSTCKEEGCGKGICIIQGKELSVQCLDYIRDETKIREREKILLPTAKKRKPLMKELLQ